MKRWLVNLLSLLAGLTLSFFLVDSQLLEGIVVRISELFATLVPLITYGMLFFFASAGIASLNLQCLTRKTLSWTGLWIVSAGALLLFTGGLFAYLMPASDISRFLTQNSGVTALFSTGDIQTRLALVLSGPQYGPFFLSFGLLLPVMGIALYLGFGITPTRDVIRPAFAVMNSFSEVCYRLLASISLFMNAGLACMSGLFLSRMFMISSWQALQPLLLFLLFAVLIIIGLLFPLLIVIFTRERNPFALISGLFSPLLFAAGSGTSSYALPIILEHTRENLGTAKRITALSIPAISLFGRIGSAFVSSFIIIALYTDAAGGQILPAVTVSIVVLSGAFSLLSYAFPGFEVLFIIMGVSQVLGLEFISASLPVFYLILRPLLQGIAAVIDTMSCGLGAASCGYIMHAHIPVSAKDRI